MMEYWQDIKNNPSKMKCVFDYVVDSIEDMKLTNEKAYWKARLGLHESIYIYMDVILTVHLFIMQLAKWRMLMVLGVNIGQVTKQNLY